MVWQNNAGHGGPNGVPKDQKQTLEAMLMAAKAIGKDGKLVGYFEALAVKQPKLFVALLGRLLACEEPEVNEQRPVLVLTEDEAKY